MEQPLGRGLDLPGMRLAPWRNLAVNAEPPQTLQTSTSMHITVMRLRPAMRSLGEVAGCMQAPALNTTTGYTTDNLWFGPTAQAIHAARLPLRRYAIPGGNAAAGALCDGA